MSGKLWSKGEMRILQSTAHMGIKFLCEQLARRTSIAIRQKAKHEHIRMGESKRGVDGHLLRGKVRVPEHVHPLVRQLFTAINVEQAFLYEVAERSGLDRSTLASWRRNVPRLDNFDAALNSIGLKLAIVPLAKERR